MLSYVTSPFLFGKKKIDKAHTSVWECKEICDIFLSFGFNVDVIYFENTKFIPKKKYSIFLDIHHNLERLNKFLPHDCIKIFHATGSFWLFQNYQEFNRIYDLFKRNGIALKPRRIVDKSDAMSLCTVATILGNEITKKTFGEYEKEMILIPASEICKFEFYSEKKFEKCKNTFLWLGSKGLVHKGLDLVLDAFKEMEDKFLHICGPVKQEDDFEKYYHNELYNRKNIKTWDWVDIRSRQFKEIVSETVAFIYPSCSEGTAGSVVTCMHAGLIPIITKETGVYVKHNCGIMLDVCTVKTIKNAIEMISQRTNDELLEMSLNTWKTARDRYTREKFSQAFSNLIRKMLNPNG